MTPESSSASQTQAARHGKTVAARDAGRGRTAMATVTERPEAPGEDERGREPWLPTRVVYTGGPPESDPRRLIPELGFREYWYPLVGRAEVSRRKPRMIKLLGEELCVFRGAH